MMDRLDCGLVELKFAGAETMTFSGYGAVFGNIDAYGDVIDPGAFAKNLAAIQEKSAAWPLMLSQHGGWQVTAEDMTPIGKWTSFAEDGKGLKVEGQLANTQRGRDMYELMKMGAISGLSIGYIAKESVPRSAPDEPKRRLKAIDLIEVSIVSRPANPKARIDAVKSIESLQSIGDAEEYLRSRGLSKSEAVALISRIKSVGPGDPVGTGGPGDPVAELVAALKRRERALP